MLAEVDQRAAAREPVPCRTNRADLQKKRGDDLAETDPSARRIQ